MVSSTASPTGMTLYQQMGDPVNAVVVIGTAIAKSRLFGCDNGRTRSSFGLGMYGSRHAPFDSG
jgi:hypothetical protein